MKRKILLAFAVALLLGLLSAVPVSADPCEGRQNCLGDICTACGCAWQVPCWSGDPCDEGAFSIGVLCVPCGDTWYPACPTGDPCDPWHNPAVICTPCGGEGEPLCWTGDQCKPGYEVEGWQFPLCYAKPAAPSEPETTGYDGAVPEQTRGEPLWGWVATHEHQFANLAYGGVSLWGEVFNPDGDASTALAECDYATEEEFDEVVLPSLWGMVDEPPEFLSEWLAAIADEYTHMGLGWVRDQLDWLAATILEPFGPVGDWLLSLLDHIPDEWDWLVAWLPGAIDGFIEWLEPQVGPVAHFLGPAFVQGLYIDLDPLIPPWDVVPRYGIHGDDPLSQPTSPSQFWLGLTVNMAVNESPVEFHGIGGYPDFEDWPTWDNGGHQQMYYKWLERAYQGGLRLLVNLTVNNAVLCEMSFQRRDFADAGGCDDMAAVDRQIDAIKALEKFIDEQDDGEQDGDGWYRVAHSAAEARQIIEDGAMAVIIGIEVDTLFGCKPDTNYCCQPGPDANCLDQGYTSYEDFIAKKVQEYYDKGVRYIYPVHFWDNKFTGGAPYRDIFVYAQLLNNGSCYELYDCSDLGYGYKIGEEAPAALNFIFQDLTERLGMEPCTEYGDYEAACNQRGLTEEGFGLIDELMERDMLIDYDHLPLRASFGYSITVGGEWQFWPGLLDIAEDWDGSRGYKYPVVSSHSTVRPDYYRGSESGAFYSAAVRIRDLGGVVSVPQPAGDCGTTRQFIDGWGGPEADARFALPSGLLEDLEANHFTQGLWDAFASNGYTLTMPFTGTVEVRTIEEASGVEWQILDFGPTGGFRFRVKKVDGTLNVHRENYGMGYVEQVEFMSWGLPEEQQDYPRIGVRSDFGAFLPQAAPRFVWNEAEQKYDWRCKEYDEETELVYPFDAFDGSGQFDMQVTGNRTFDYNTQGLAHVGLWVDLLADARAISESNPPTTTVDFEPVFNSAEAYIRMWEWIENCTPDEVPPVITCPGTIITSGGVGGTTVGYEPPPAAIDLCDWIPPDVHILTTDPVSGSLFEMGTHTVWATSTDFSGNASQCSFDVQVSCFQVNQARVGVECEGLAELDLVYGGQDGALVDVRGFGTFSVDDGDHILLQATDLAQEVLNATTLLQIDRERTTIPTSCAAAIETGDVFGPFTVHGLAWVFDDAAPPQKVEIKGTFRPAAPVDLTAVDVTYTIADGDGDTLTYVTPAGSFEVEGKPSLQKYRYDSAKGSVPGISARFDFNRYTFELSLDGVDTYDIAGSELAIGLQTGTGLQRHYGLETVPMRVTPRQLDYLAAPQWDCSP